MHTSTVVVLLCLIAAVAARAQPETAPVDAQQSLLDTPVHDRSPRTKRGLLLLKKKLILGALGLKAAKAGVVGAAGLVGALALKAKSKAVAAHTSFYHHSRYYGHDGHDSETETERW